jgi:predicted KAP-like P-loop ATPase
MMALSSDRALVDPADDKFGHAPFAKHLATAISKYKSDDGIVLALYGPWGSGKSTVLGFVQYYLGQLPDSERPVVVQFNPWWFSGQENLARTFLGQLQVILPAKFAGFKKVGDSLAKFGEAIGGVAGAAGAAHGIPGTGGLVKAVLGWFGSKPKDVPALKKELSELLVEKGKRVLVVIDDIDRLAPEEVRQLFTVIKALADFPFITYLLAFDREVAAGAIQQQTGLPGDRYLEKIIQVPFELPTVDQVSLRNALFDQLNAVLASHPDTAFDQDHWSNIYFSGMDAMIRVPRDIIRLVNSLQVTYAAVAGEVNPVDFIALEFIRVFLPGLYDVIRSNEEKFFGHHAPEHQQDKQVESAFHESWLKEVPDAWRPSTKDMMERLFPRLESVWSNMQYSADSALDWRRQLRICSPDVFPAYFRLTFHPGDIRPTELNALLAIDDDGAALKAALLAASKIGRPDGISKASALLERLMDHVPKDISPNKVPTYIRALTYVGDQLLSEGDDPPGTFGFGNVSRVGRLLYHLLKRVADAERPALALDAIIAGKSLRVPMRLVGSLDDEAQKAARGEGDALFDLAAVDALKQACIVKVKAAAGTDALIKHPQLVSILSGWRHWGGEQEVRAWWQAAAKVDVALITLISGFQSHVRSSTFGDHAVRVRIRVNPKSIEQYGDIKEMSARVSALLDEGKVPEEHRAAIEQFLLECKMIEEGKNPEDPFAFED